MQTRPTLLRNLDSLVNGHDLVPDGVVAPNMDGARNPLEAQASRHQFDQLKGDEKWLLLLL